MNVARRFSLLILSLFLLSTVLPAQQKPRKRVAVVLSGGGAKGMAHIGALRVIERAGIPVDIITGTSMGSIIGGLYSIGYDSHRLDSMVRVQDWSFVLSDRDDVKNKSLSDRHRQNTYMLMKTFTLDKEKNIAETGGVIQGKNLSVLFNKLTAGYHDSIDFNKLPIPFACVATNIIDNTEYDFHSGVLAQAMRTSMSIPAAFAPIRKGGMMLVDGGLRNNYPADIARQMGADVIIGVTVQGPPKTADDLRKGSDILGQIVDVNCKNKYDDNLAMTDVAIRVNTKGYNAASFNDVAIDTLIRRGEDEAMKHWDELIALKKVIGIDSTFVPRKIELNPATALPDTASVAPVSLKNTSNQLLAGLGVRFDTEEMVALQINGIYKPKNSPMNIEATLRLGKRIMGRLDANLNPSGMNKMRLSYIFRHNDVNIYNGGSRDFNMTYNYHAVDFSVFDFNIRNFNVNLGARFDYYNYHDVLIGTHTDADFDHLSDEHYFSYYLNVNYNSEDKWSFPTRGAKFLAGYAYYNDNFVDYKGHIGFSMLKAMWRMSFPLNSRLTLQPMAYGRMLFGKDIPYSQYNMVGGMWFDHYIDHQMPLAGMGYMEHTDDQFTALQMKLQQRIADNNYVLVAVSGAQHSNKLKDLLNDTPILGGEIGYFYNTILGPLGATLGYSSKTKEPYFYINLGFEF
jgi:NTE family protein